MTEQLITLPPEPPDGTVVEIVDGQNKGNRYRRYDTTWRELNIDGTEGRYYTWSAIWWAVTEDASGGTTLRVVPPDPHPLPWAVDGAVVLDARGGLVCETHAAAARRIVAAVNRGPA